MRLVSVVTSTRSLRAARMADFFEQIVHLALHRAHFDFRIDEARGPNHLLDNHAAGFRQFVGAGSGGNVDHLIGAMLEFLEIQRAIIEGRGHAETVIHERLFARAVAMIHAADLRDGLVRFVHEQQIIRRNVIEQRGRRFARQAAGKMPRIIFDAVAVADGAHHFDIEVRALHDALRFDDFSLAARARVSTIRALRRCFEWRVPFASAGRT